MNASRFSGSFRDSLRNLVRIPLLGLEWLVERVRLSGRKRADSASRPVGSVLIACADPREITGSKGDEAMIAAVVEKLRETHPGCEFGILTTGAPRPAGAAPLEIREEPHWANPWSLRRVVDVIERYDAVVVVGADVMDGYYSAVSAARLWVVADLAARVCRHGIVLGFSFNASPSPWLRPFIRRVDRAAAVCVRDAVSLERFGWISDGRGQLVADAAFLLRPRTSNATVQRVAEWVASRRSLGRVVLAFNIHPMLFARADRGGVERAVAASARMIEAVIRRHGASVLLVSHDYRGTGLGEGAMLEAVLARIPRGLADDLLYFGEQLHAAELKGVAGLVDAVVTGRMHFAIAALGQSVPVAAITYQGKFDGLFGHFRFPDGLLISPAEVIAGDALLELTIRLLERREELAARVAARLPEVLGLAALNLSALRAAPR